MSSTAAANQTVNGITIDEDLPQARRGTAYSHTVPVISGGTAPYTFSILGGSTLPTSLTLSSTGVVSGVISCLAGNGNFGQDIRIVDSSAPTPITADFTANKGLAINVTAGPAGTCVTLTISPVSLPAPTVGVAYSETITASGGLGPYTYSVSAGSLPAGLSLDAATGVISGTPIASGAFSFTILATDAAQSTGTRVFSGTVNAPAPIVVNPATLPASTLGVAYSQTVSATGGNGVYTFSVSAGALPTGLSLNAGTGAITGTSTAAGTFNFTITATDGLAATGSRAYSVTINPAVVVNPATLPASTINVAYSQTVTSTGGTGAVTFAVTAGALPTGLSLNGATGAITGNSSAAGTFNFTITGTDTVGATGSRAYAVTINAAVVVNPPTLPASTINVAYSQTVTSTGGTGAVAFAVTAGALPTGLSLDGGTGAITGTPSAAGTFNFTVTGTDTVGATGLRAYSVTINPALVVNPATLPDGTVGTAYSQTVTTTGGTGVIAFDVSVGSLPAGLSLNPSTGAITGTPTTAATSNFTVRATDTVGGIGTRAYSIIIGAAATPITVNPATLPASTLGLAYSQTVSATGGNGVYTFSVSAGALPTGLSLNAGTGAITGTSTAAGTFNFTITATDGLAATGSRAYSVTINPAVVVNPATLPASTINVAYSQTVASTGGTGAVAFTVTAGALPTGLSLNGATGEITGTSSAAGTFNFTITGTDTVGATGSRAYSVTINPAVVVNPATLPASTINVAYSQTVTSTGGTGAVAFTLTAGALPTGLSLNAGTGAITGTPSAAGTFNFTITGTDTVGATGSRAYSVTINPAVAVNPATLPDGTVGTGYSQTVTTTGGTGSTTFSVSAGALPAGLSLNAGTGQISGTPTTAATSNFTLTATDSVGATGSRAYSLTVNAAAAIVVNPATLPASTLGVAYSQTVSATGGNGVYTFSVSAGALPSGLSLNAASGLISGTSTAAGTFNFTITATDGLAATGSRAYSVTINAAVVVNPATLPASTINVAYSQTVTSTGGTGAVAFTVTAGALPTGLSLNAGTGAITGTPSAAGTFNFTVTGTDTVGATGSRAYSVTINAAIVVNPATLPDGSVGSAYSQTVTTTGGTGAATFAVTAGSLPVGLSLNAGTGVISGTPTTAATSNFTITATDTVGATGSRAYSVTTNSAIVVNPATLPASTLSVAYSQTVSATGGNGVYAFSVSAGALPSGLSLNAASGLISGTSTAAGTFNFTITATDGLAATGSRAYSVTINAAITVNPATLPAGTVGGAYSQTVTSTGGTGSISFAISAGTLPTGLSLNAGTGVISGTPTTAATSNFTVTATDSVGATGSRAYALTINPGIAVNPVTLPASTVGAGYAQTVTATGGNGVYTFAVSAGALPAGLSLNAATGQITGTPTAAATANFTITATDGLGATGSRAYSVTINPALVVNPATLPAGTVGSAYSQTLTATGGTGSATFAVSTGALPAGLSLNAATGQIAGTPTSAATANFTVTATDAVGATGMRAYSLVVNAGVTVNPATLPTAMAGAAYSQALSALGGNGSYTYSISAGALPAGLTLNAATGVVSGTPTSSAAANVTITATDGLGATGSRAYTLNVAAALAVGPATLPNATAGSPYSQLLIPVGGTAPFAFAVTAGTLPAGLVLDPATGAISGTPTAAATANFTITVTDGAGFMTSRAYTMTVAPPVLTLTSGYASGRVGSGYDQAIQVSGGLAPYAFSVTGGQVPPGLSINPTTGALTGTPTASGTFTFTVTVVDANGASASFEQTVFIESRPDPTLETSVRGVNAAQIAAASRFGSAQIGNVTSRLQTLHTGHDPCSNEINIGTNARWERVERSESRDDRAAEKPAAAESKDRARSGCDRPFAVWAGGTIDFGFLRPSGTAHRNDFTTAGVTLGIDARLMKELIVGAALGYGRDSTDVDPSGSHSKGQAQSGSVYGSYRIAPSVFVEALLGHGRMDFDARRWSAPAGMLVTGDRSGSQTFGALGLTGVVRLVGVTLAPYGRIDRVRSTLDSYSETGNANVALNYAELTVNDDSILVGMRGSMDIALQRLTLTPSLRLEQRRTRSRGAEQSVSYADAPATAYPLLHAGESNDFTSAGIGLLLRMGAVFTVDIEYTYTAGSGAARSETVRALLRAPF